MAKPITGKITTSEWRQKLKNGDIYVWQRQTTYIPETRRTKELSRKLLGKIPAGSLDGKMVPTRPKRKPQPKADAPEAVSAAEPVAAAKPVGMADLLEWAGRESGVSEDLRISTDEGTAQKIETIAWFWTANPGAHLTQLERWMSLRRTPYASPISRECYHRLFKETGPDADFMNRFFRASAARTGPGSCLAVDSTTVSTYSRLNGRARQGFNKAGDGRDTVKVMTVFDVEACRPIAFMQLPSTSSDVRDLELALKQMQSLGVRQPRIVTDRGYYSQDNIAQMVRRSMKFLTAVPVRVSWVASRLGEGKARLRAAATACPWDFAVNGFTVPVTAGFTFERLRSSGGVPKGAAVTEEHRLYLHLFRDEDAAADEGKEFKNDVLSLRNNVESGLCDPDDPDFKAAVDRYLSLSRAGRGGKLKVAVNEEAYAEELDDLGYFALVSNKKEDCFEALEVYRLRERIEEAFRDIKCNADGRNTRVWDGENLKGRMFCQFVYLSLHCFLQGRIKRLKAELKAAQSDGSLTEGEKKERKGLLAWLDGKSVADIIGWIDNIEIGEFVTAGRTIRQRYGDTKRDRLFFRLLGVPGYEEKPLAKVRA